MTKRKEIPVKNNPGICKPVQCDKSSGLWMDTGFYRVIRRTDVDEYPKKEQAVFRSLEEAKAFRRKNDAATTGRSVHQVDPDTPDEGMRCGALVKEWKALHYLQLELAMKQMDDRRLPHPDFLHNIPVERITMQIDGGVLRYCSGGEESKRPRSIPTFNHWSIVE